MLGGRTSPKIKGEVRPRDIVEIKIIDQLRREALSIDIMSRNLGMPVAKMGTILSMMQLRGQIKQEGNKYYVN